MVIECKGCGGRKRAMTGWETERDEHGMTMTYRCPICRTEYKMYRRLLWAVVDYAKIGAVVWSVTDIPKEAFVAKGFESEWEARSAAKSMPGLRLQIEKYYEFTEGIDA